MQPSATAGQVWLRRPVGSESSEWIVQLWRKAGDDDGQHERGKAQAGRGLGHAVREQLGAADQSGGHGFGAIV
jgi:hypothetical protein